MDSVWRVAAGVVGLGAGVLAWSTLVEPRAFALREFEVPALPSGARPLRVLHPSDLHLVPGQHAKRAWVRSLA
ncbi:MAG TPA: metallophosphoesterase, partial [Ornithinicoccus sp.]|nr:metallophosphoesterase [Ornithinicoccus sp.]